MMFEKQCKSGSDKLKAASSPSLENAAGAVLASDAVRDSIGTEAAVLKANETDSDRTAVMSPLDESPTSPSGPQRSSHASEPDDRLSNKRARSDP